MSKRLTFSKFRGLPLKVRNSLVKEVLTDKWGYNIESNDKRRERSILKALSTFQKDNGLGPNGVVCEKTFNALHLYDK